VGDCPCYFRFTLMIHFKILLSGCCNKDYSTLFTLLLHCLLIYYTYDVKICVENGSWQIYVMHSILPSEPGVTHVTESKCVVSWDWKVGPEANWPDPGGRARGAKMLRPVRASVIIGPKLVLRPIRVENPFFYCFSYFFPPFSSSKS
jgi:hypothetical protein